MSGCGVNFKKRTNIISPQIYYVVSKQANNIMLYGCKPSEMLVFYWKKREKKRRQKVINAHKVQFLLDELGN